MSDVIVAPETRDLLLLGEQLASWFGKRLPQATDLRLDNLTYPRGAGQSHETILFDASWKESGKQRTRKAMWCASSPPVTPSFPTICSSSNTASCR